MPLLQYNIIRHAPIYRSYIIIGRYSPCCLPSVYNLQMPCPDGIDWWFLLCWINLETVNFKKWSLSCERRIYNIGYWINNIAYLLNTDGISPCVHQRIALNGIRFKTQNNVTKSIDLLFSYCVYVRTCRAEHLTSFSCELPIT